MSKFNIGDSVEIIGRKDLTGKITSKSLDFLGGYDYEVEFDQTQLIPNSMSYAESRIKLVKTDPSKSPSYQSSISPWAEHYYSMGTSDETNCPKCKREWTITKSPVLHDEWKTCNVCNLRKEDI